MEFNYFDIIGLILILLLGLKGIFNGFFKEAFGLIGIIGGLFVASRAGDKVGAYLNENIFHFSNDSAIAFTGFLFTLIAFWIAMILVGFAFKKLSSLSGLGLIDRILGFIFASGKFFLIAAVIAFAVYNVKSLKPTITSVTKGSLLFPVLVETGGYIMKIDPTKMSSEINTTIDKTTQKVKANIQENVVEQVKKAVNDTKEKMQQFREKKDTTKIDSNSEN